MDTKKINYSVYAVYAYMYTPGQYTPIWHTTVYAVWRKVGSFGKELRLTNALEYTLDPAGWAGLGRARSDRVRSGLAESCGVELGRVRVGDLG